MERISRRHLLKMGAGGAAAGVALAVPGVAHADDGGGALFVHIDGVNLDGGEAGLVNIDIDLAGTRRNLRGEGWDTDPPENPESACIFVQSGSFRRHRVEVQGRVIFANDPQFLGALVKTMANAKTGEIVFDFGGFVFTGTGRVVVAHAQRRPDHDD